MDHTAPDQNVGSSVPFVAIIATVVALAVIVGGFYLFRSVSGDKDRLEIVIASGAEGGTYHELGEGLARIAMGNGVVENAKVLTTGGSVDNMELIERGADGADLAFVQSDTPPSTNARLVASLYGEVLHILASKKVADEIQGIEDLSQKRVSLGPVGSGTRQLSQRVLEHFGVEVAEDLALLPAEAAAGLIEGSLDAAFVLNAIPSQIVAELAEKDAIRFV